MKQLVFSAFASTFLICATSSNASTFDIQIDFVPAGLNNQAFPGNPVFPTQDFTDRQKDLFGAAESFWETVLTGFNGVIDPVLTLTVTLAPIDNLNGILAFAGVTGTESVGSNPANGSANFFRATTGIIQVDSVDYGPRSEQDFLNVAIHEIAHTLGFNGPIFRLNGLVDPSDDRAYIGANALAEFNSETGSSLTSILLDESGSHWSECFIVGLTNSLCSESPSDSNFVNDTESLTPFASNGNTTFSSISAAAFRDLGYETSEAASFILPLATDVSATPVPLPAGGWLLAAGMMGLAGLRRQKRAA
ncbi:MAG: VPLPA-CTERM sorting domain-containing protein [Aliishimia sp.]